MSDKDPDVCLQQLKAANTEIENTDKLNKGIDETRVKLKNEYEALNRTYLEKKKEYNTALATYNNYLAKNITIAKK